MKKYGDRIAKTKCVSDTIYAHNIQYPFILDLTQFELYNNMTVC